MSSIPELCTVKPYLVPMVKVMTEKLGITIDLAHDPKDEDHDNQFILVHSIDADNSLEAGSYEKYKYMDGCIPGSAADKRITITELMFYFDTICRYSKKSPIHARYQEIRKAIDAARIADGVVDPTADDAERTLEKTLQDNILLVAYQWSKEISGKTLEEYLVEKYPEQKKFITDAMGVLATVPLGLYDQTKSVAEYEKIKEKLYGLIKNAYTNNERGFFINKLMFDSRFLAVRVMPYREEYTCADVDAQLDPTAVDMIKLSQYAEDTERKGYCRQTSTLFLGLADQFEVNARAVGFVRYSSAGAIDRHIQVDLFNDPENLAKDITVVDRDVFNAPTEWEESSQRVQYMSTYNYIGHYLQSIEQQYLLSSKKIPQDVFLGQTLGRALDYYDGLAEDTLENIAFPIYAYGSQSIKSACYSFGEISIRTYMEGLFLMMPRLRLLYVDVVYNFGYYSLDAVKALWLKNTGRSW